LLSGCIREAVADIVSLLSRGPSFTSAWIWITCTGRISSVTCRAVWRSAGHSSNVSSLYETWTSATLVSVFWSNTRIALFISGKIVCGSSASDTPSTIWLTSNALLWGRISDAVAVAISALSNGLSLISVCTWVTCTGRCSSVVSFADCGSPEEKSSSGDSLNDTCTSDTQVSKFWSKIQEAFFVSGLVDDNSSDSEAPSTTWLTLSALLVDWITSAVAVTLLVSTNGFSFIAACICITSTVRCSSVTARADWSLPEWKSSNGASLCKSWTLATQVSVFWSCTQTALLTSGSFACDKCPSNDPSTTWLILMAFFSGWISSAVADMSSVLLKRLSFVPACTWVTWTVCCSSVIARADWAGPDRKSSIGASL